jgi:hypothetical protein
MWAIAEGQSIDSARVVVAWEGVVPSGARR